MSEFNAKDAAKRAAEPLDGAEFRVARDLLSALSLLKRTGEALQKMRATSWAVTPDWSREVWEKSEDQADAVLADLRRAGVLEEEPNA